MHMILLILGMMLFLAIFIGLQLYVAWRLKELFGIEKKRHVYIPVITATVGSIIFLILLNLTSNIFVFLIYRLLSIWMGIFLFLICYLIIFELVNGMVLLLKIPRIPKRIRIPERISIPKRIAGITVVILSVLTSTYGVWNGYDVDVERVEIQVENLNGTVDIAVLSDIHIGSGGGKGTLKRLVKKTNSLNPDIVLIPGDLADGDAFITEDIFGPLKELKAPTYFVTGNHETYVDEEKMIKILNRSGVHVLDNEIVETHGIQLIGLSFMGEDEGSDPDMINSGKNKTIKNVLPGLNISDDTPAIMMHHSPVGTPYAQRAGVDLYIAGHTHGGGQIFPLTLIAGSAFDYSKGLYHYKDMDVYVSQGAGTWFVPMRVGTDNEITLIRLIGNN